jgi:hypothetical protein
MYNHKWKQKKKYFQLKSHKPLLIIVYIVSEASVNENKN